eukprot:TRINITY_DN27123_c0_g1_i1.p1 TRINITY_DN27123_c0_g1~~TRINITY_DN27123_c0_g1_i1.p1  ORF type:complete len:1029 (+),score=111.46 TRINITY_DN27123_c0_g1_i1:142-3228(+)
MSASSDDDDGPRLRDIYTEEQRIDAMKRAVTESSIGLRSPVKGPSFTAASVVHGNVVPGTMFGLSTPLPASFVAPGPIGGPVFAGPALCRSPSGSHAQALAAIPGGIPIQGAVGTPGPPCPPLPAPGLYTPSSGVRTTYPMLPPSAATPTAPGPRAVQGPPVVPKFTSPGTVQRTSTEQGSFNLPTGVRRQRSTVARPSPSRSPSRPPPAKVNPPARQQLAKPGTPSKSAAHVVTSKSQAYTAASASSDPSVRARSAMHRHTYAVIRSSSRPSCSPSPARYLVRPPSGATIIRSASAAPSDAHATGNGAPSDINRQSSRPGRVSMPSSAKQSSLGQSKSLGFLPPRFRSNSDSVDSGSPLGASSNASNLVVQTMKAPLDSAVQILDKSKQDIPLAHEQEVEGEELHDNRPGKKDQVFNPSAIASAEKNLLSHCERQEESANFDGITSPLCQDNRDINLQRTASEAVKVDSGSPSNAASKQHGEPHGTLQIQERHSSPSLAINKHIQLMIEMRKTRSAIQQLEQSMNGMNGGSLHEKTSSTSTDASQLVELSAASDGCTGGLGLATADVLLSLGKLHHDDGSRGGKGIELSPVARLRTEMITIRQEMLDKLTKLHDSSPTSSSLGAKDASLTQSLMDAERSGEQGVRLGERKAACALSGTGSDTCSGDGSPSGDFSATHHRACSSNASRVAPLVPPLPLWELANDGNFGIEADHTLLMTPKTDEAGSGAPKSTTLAEEADAASLPRWGRCGEGLRISEDGLVARRVGSLQQGAVLLGGAPLLQLSGGRYFEVELLECNEEGDAAAPAAAGDAAADAATTPRQFCGLAVGVTHANPQQLRDLPEKARWLPHAYVAGYDGLCILGNREQSTRWRPGFLRAGQRVGILNASGGPHGLIIFVDGSPVLKVARSSMMVAGFREMMPLYPVVDLGTSVRAVRFVGNTCSSPQKLLGSLCSSDDNDSGEVAAVCLSPSSAASDTPRETAELDAMSDAGEPLVVRTTNSRRSLAHGWAWAQAADADAEHPHPVEVRC